MKALSFASILALAIAGTACSQTAEDPPETPEAETETAAEPEVDMTGFNLGLPTEMEPTAPAPASEFNLGLGDPTTTSTDGFNLETELGASSGLSEIPEIDSSIVEEETEEIPTPLVDDEPVIRLE